MTQRLKGKVKFFSEKRGYGFITGEDNKEYFVHYSKIRGAGFKNLLEGQSVEFEIFDAPKGPVAIEVEAK